MLSLRSTTHMRSSLEKEGGANNGGGKRGSEREKDRERSEGEGDDEMRELQRTWAKQFSYSSPQPVRKATERATALRGRVEKEWSKG